MRKHILLKTVCIIIFLLAANSLNTVCSADEYSGQVSDTEGSSEIKLTYFKAAPSGGSDIVENLCETEAYKELENRTDIRISFFHADTDTRYHKLLLMIASGDLPDLV